MKIYYFGYLETKKNIGVCPPHVFSSDDKCIYMACHLQGFVVKAICVNKAMRRENYHIELEKQIEVEKRVETRKIVSWIEQLSMSKARFKSVRLHK